MGADRRLNRDIEHLTRNELPHLGNELASAVMRVVAMHDQRQRVDALPVDQNVELDEIAGAIFEEVVIERGVTTGNGLQAVKEIHHDLVQRQFVSEHDLPPEILHIALYAALLHAKRDHGADIVLWHENGSGNDRFADFIDLRGIGKLRGIFNFEHRPVAQRHFVDHRRRGGNERHAVFALEPFLHDIHVQQAQEAAAESEAQRLRRFGLIAQRGIVEVQFLQRIP
ncbi:hypothetical protein D3C83_05280 [compost metagenome]